MAAALGAITLFAFSPVIGNGFVHWDDEVYLFGNAVVSQGLSLEGVRWAFTTGTAAIWHPLTWLSHMLDVELFGMSPGGHHAVSLALHLGSALLLFRFLLSGTGCRWRSAFVAALFAVHPLHVESVAWASARKDVLSGAFFMLTLLAYLAYARRPAAGRYALVAGSFALGLMAKPTVVMLPAVLLLLDYWPLGRIDARGGRRGGPALLLEKAPLLPLSAGATLVTFLAESEGGAVSDLGAVPPGRRLENVLVGYVFYLWKTVVPTDLSFLYPFPLRPPPAALVLACGGLLATATILAAANLRRRPMLLVGWLWYLVTLLPVIGIVQFGPHAFADRFSYLPLVGIFLIAGWFMPAMPSRRAWQATVVGAAVVLIVGSAVAARKQVGHWRDDRSLFGHALETDPENWVARNNFGNALVAEGRLAEAIPHFEAAVRANPGYGRAWNNLGLASYHGGRLPEAESQFRKAVALRPEDAEARGNLGSALLRLGRPREALEELEQARRLDPRNPVTLTNLGSAWHQLGDLPRAENSYREALLLKPDHPSAKAGLEAVRRLRGR